MNDKNKWGEKTMLIVALALFLAFAVLAGFGFLAKVSDTSSLSAVMDKWGPLFCAFFLFVGMAFAILIFEFDKIEKSISELKDKENEKDPLEDAGDEGL